jgi:beta-lactam-binding protein with PASTA domain
MFKIIKKNSFIKNLLFALTLLSFLFVVWLKWLDIYTNHNDFVKVPDFNGIHVDELDSIVHSHSLRYEIIDSVFYKSYPKGVVINQDPFADTDVKSNRKIYLTINSLKLRKVNFPDIFDLALRQAVSKLQKNGLEVGKLEYRPDIATNKVLDFKVNGISIDVGQELYHGTTIDLIVGQGLSNKKVRVPNLIGLSRVEANIILKSTSLNVGLEYFNNEVSDSNFVVIYKQYPKPHESKEISIGSLIDLYFEVPELDSL